MKTVTKQRQAYSARGLNQYCQPTDKKIQETSRIIWNFSRNFKICMYLNLLIFRRTLVWKHCPKHH
jgi:hypothetical protein